MRSNTVSILAEKQATMMCPDFMISGYLRD